MQIFSREIWTQISAMAPNRAVLHQAMAEEDLLASDNVLSGEERGARWICDTPWNRWSVTVRTSSEVTENREARYHQQDKTSLPPWRKFGIHSVSALFCLLGCPSGESNL